MKSTGCSFSFHRSSEIFDCLEYSARFDGAEIKIKVPPLTKRRDISESMEHCIKTSGRHGTDRSSILSHTNPTLVSSNDRSPVVV